MSSIRCNLLAWYATAARKLPWRETCDPYQIWIAEIMLQQTQVNTVLPRFAVWFKRFPDIASLATAPLDDVLKAWEGLGYYRRARFIHAAAREIMTTHQGRFPQAFDEILKLPGIGRSTAGAIASCCFAVNTPVLDGNVKRVLRRWHALADATEKELWLRAQHAIDQTQHPALWNQAMMELGAMLCTPRHPCCAACPVSKQCAAAFQVKETRDGMRVRTLIRDVHWQVTLHRHAEKGIWLTQRPAQGIWAGLWTPPIVSMDKAPTQKPSHIHLLTHRRLHLYVKTSMAKPDGDGRWVADLAQLALPTGIHRLLEKHGA